MPVHKEKGGYQYGKSGKIYHGKDAKEKAIKQGVAIKISQMKESGKKSKPGYKIASKSMISRRKDNNE